MKTGETAVYARLRSITCPNIYSTIPTPGAFSTSHVVIGIAAGLPSSPRFSSLWRVSFRKIWAARAPVRHTKPAT